MTQVASTKKPTEAELEVLSVLWSRGDSTVREVHDVLSSARTVGYTGRIEFDTGKPDGARLGKMLTAHGIGRN